MYLVYLLTTLIVAIHLYRFSRYKIPLLHLSPHSIVLLIFLGTQIISTLISVDPHTSIFGFYSRLNGGLLSIICYITLALILPLYLDEKLKNYLIYTSLFSGLLVSIYGILQHFGIDARFWVQDVQARVFSTFGQPNWLAAYLCILLPFSTSKFLSSKNSLLTTGYLLLTTIYYLCLLFTKSKSGILATIITLGLYFFLHFFQSKKISLLQITVYSLLITLSLTINNPIKDKLFPKKLIIENSKIENLVITPSADIRKIVWEGALKLWQRFPLFGTGVETYAYSYYWTRPASHNLTSEWDFLYNKAHNEYLNYLATTGTFGIVAYLLVILSSVYLLVRYQQYYLLCSLLSILITNYAGFSVVVISLYFYLLPSLAAAKTIDSPIRRDPTLSSPIFPFLLLAFLFFFISKTISFYLADIAYSQAETAEDHSDYQAGYDYIKSALSLRPNEPNYLMELSSISAKMAATSKNSSLIDESISTSKQAMSISPSNINFWKERAQNFYYLSTIDTQKYLPLAIDSLQKAAILAPTDAKLPYLTGKFYDMAQNPSEAATFYQKAIDLKPNYDHALFDLGVLQYKNKDYQKAKTSFESVLKYAPTNTDAQDYLKKIGN